MLRKIPEFSSQTDMKILLSCASLLTAIGICLQFSASSAAHGTAFLSRQLLFVCVGTPLAILASHIDYRRIAHWAFSLLSIMSVLLFYLLLAKFFGGKGFSLPLTSEINGAYRWLKLGYFSIQPSELTKPVIVLFLASYFQKKYESRHSYTKGFLTPSLFCLMILLPALLAPSLSVTCLCGVLILAIYLMAGVRWFHCLSAIPILALAIGTFWLVSPEHRQRIEAFLDPASDPQGGSYQMLMALRALGSGGKTGLGYTYGRVKNGWIPESHTDFILAVAGEEFGFGGLCLIMLLYFLFFIACLSIALKATDFCGGLLATGLGLNVLIHAQMNMAVVSGMAPTTGVYAPFISYGGSGLLSSLLSCAILVNISRISCRDLPNRSWIKLSMSDRLNPL